MILREAQLRVFQADRDRRFAVWFVEQLRAEDPRRWEGTRDAELEGAVLAGLERGRRYGLRDGAALRMFLDARFRYSQSFDEHPRIRPLWSDPGKEPEERLYEAVATAGTLPWSEP